MKFTELGLDDKGEPKGSIEDNSKFIYDNVTGKATIIEKPNVKFHESP